MKGSIRKLIPAWATTKLRNSCAHKRNQLSLESRPAKCLGDFWDRFYILNHLCTLLALATFSLIQEGAVLYNYVFPFPNYSTVSAIDSSSCCTRTLYLPLTTATQNEPFNIRQVFLDQIHKVLYGQSTNCEPRRKHRRGRWFRIKFIVTIRYYNFFRTSFQSFATFALRGTSPFDGSGTMIASRRR